MSNQEHLKLIVVYDANRNEYSISAHNQSAEQAQQVVERWNPHLVSGCSLIALDQLKRHRTEDAQDCRTCRDIVARSVNLTPKPKFIRRKEQ